jgi:hypothetical protein
MSSWASIRKYAGRFIDYLVAVVRHYVLLLGGAFLTFILPHIETGVFTSAEAQADIQALVNHFSIPIGCTLLFFATFLSWNEQKDLAEKSSPENLKAELVKQLSPREFTEEQADLLSSTLEELRSETGSLFGLVVVANPVNSEAVHYGMEMWGRLPDLVMYHHSNQISIDLQGVFISVKTLDPIPSRARKLSEALTRAHVAHDFRVLKWPHQSIMPDNFYELVIGKRKD